MKSEDRSLSSFCGGIGREARLLLLVSAILASVAVMSVSDAQESDALDAGEQFWSDDVCYEVLDEPGKVCAVRLDDVARVVIPATVTYDETYDVKYVNFNGCYSLKAAVLSPGIEGIGLPESGDGFRCCYNLTDVVIPDTVTWIAEDAFLDCYALKSLYIPDSVSAIAPGAFRGSGISLIRLPENPEFTALPDRLFAGCSFLQSVVIPSNVTSIGTLCFLDCDSLVQITIPENVSVLSDSALGGANGLTFIDLRCDESADFGSGSLIPNYLGSLVKIKTEISPDLLIAAEAIDEHAQVGPNLEYGYSLEGYVIQDDGRTNNAWKLVDGVLEVWALSPDYTTLYEGSRFKVDGDSALDVFSLIRDVEFVDDPYNGKYLITEIGNGVFYDNWQDSVMLPDGFTTVSDYGIDGTRIVKVSSSVDVMNNPGTTMTLIVPDKEMDGFGINWEVSALIVEVDGLLDEDGPLKYFRDGGSINGVVYLAGSSKPMVPVMMSEWDIESLCENQLYSDVDGTVWKVVWNNEGAKEWVQDASLRTVVFDLNDGSGIQLRKVVSDGFAIGCADFVYSAKDDFAGWFSEDGRFVSPDTLVSEVFGDSYLVTLQARWDGAFVVLGTGVTATVDGEVFTRYATVPLGSSMTVSFDEGRDLYCAAGFEVSGSALTPVEGAQTHSVTARDVGTTLVALDLNGGEGDCTSFRATIGSPLPDSYS
ncbi:MAG: leucine-rich repeat protein, partial [Candidatus Methanomethylophilaceae archaeon]|nr:leucine-rich repeat protein [Candidatus Methanomethylophilaceae archaeon]